MIEMLVHTEQCKGCGLCQAACPKKLLEVSAQLNAKGITGSFNRCRKLYRLRVMCRMCRIW